MLETIQQVAVLIDANHNYEKKVTHVTQQITIVPMRGSQKVIPIVLMIMITHVKLHVIMQLVFDWDNFSSMSLSFATCKSTLGKLMVLV
jgi:hypothetical protein